MTLLERCKRGNACKKKSIYQSSINGFSTSNFSRDTKNALGEHRSPPRSSSHNTWLPLKMNTPVSWNTFTECCRVLLFLHSKVSLGGRRLAEEADYWPWVLTKHSDTWRVWSGLLWLEVVHLKNNRNLTTSSSIVSIGSSNKRLHNSHNIKAPLALMLWSYTNPKTSPNLQW